MDQIEKSIGKALIANFSLCKQRLSADTDIYLEKVEKHLGPKFIFLTQNFNEYGPQHVVLIEYLKGILDVCGEYSEMSPLLRRMVDACDSAGLSTGSIGGKWSGAVLTKRMMVYERGIFNQEKPQQGSGFGSLFGGGGNGNGKDKNNNSPFAGLSQ
jgi:hypothetical protein